MLNFKKSSKSIAEESATVALKQQYELDRQKRIFNARERILGVDLNGLDAQIRDKEKEKQELLLRDEQFANEEKRRNLILQHQQQEQEKQRQYIQNSLNEFRNEYQRKEFSREYDLNDRQYIQKSLPARLHDHDPRLGISSAQKFLGEDLANADRLKLQKEQQRAWILQQMTEKRCARQDKQQAEHALFKALNAQDRRASDLDAHERMNRRKIQMSIAEFNAAQAATRKQNELLGKREEEEDNLAEIYNNLTSEMLNEIKELPKVPEKYEYENNKKRAEAESVDQQWGQITNTFSKIAAQQEEEVKRKAFSIKQQIQEENKELAAKQRQQLDHLNKVVYTNAPTADYFAQFNTCSR